jgi:hypothetical protein
MADFRSPLPIVAIFFARSNGIAFRASPLQDTGDFVTSRLWIDFEAGLRMGAPIRRVVCQQAGEQNPRNSKARQWRAVMPV